MSTNSPATDGHKELKRALSPIHVLGLAMADASPVMATVLLSIGIFSVGGTFGVGACLAVTCAIIMIALNLAELGSQFPLTGGTYSLAKAILPEGAAWVAFFNVVFQGVFIPASLCLGIGQFMLSLWPGCPLNEQAIAVLALLLALYMSTRGIEAGAKSTLILMIIQAVVIIVIVAAAVVNPQNSLTEMVMNPVVLRDGILSPVTPFIMMATLVPTFSVINGYDAVLGFSEELKGGPRVLARTVVIAGIMASALITIPLVASMIAAPDLTTFLSSDSPVVYSVREALGGWAATLITVGVIIALFSTTMTLIMYFGRVWYAAARDGLWTSGINRFFTKLNRHQVPARSAYFFFVCTLVLIFSASLNWLIIFSGTMICVVYFFIGICGFMSRFKFKGRARPYSMPLWPIPSIIVIIFNGFAILMQETQYLIGEIVFAAIALACYVICKTINKKTQSVNSQNSN